jgi:hypothetical protein
MRTFPATFLYLIDSTVIYVILPKMTVHQILLYLSCLQYIMFMLFLRYIATVIYVVLSKMTVRHLLYLSCLQYIIFMLFQRCIALTYFALPRSFPDFYFIPKSSQISCLPFFYKKLKSLEYVAAILWHFPRILRQKKRAKLSIETFPT